jgi:hypothetical protein
MIIVLGCRSLVFLLELLFADSYLMRYSYKSPLIDVVPTTVSLLIFVYPRFLY